MNGRVEAGGQPRWQLIVTIEFHKEQSHHRKDVEEPTTATSPVQGAAHGVWRCGRQTVDLAILPPFRGTCACELRPSFVAYRNRKGTVWFRVACAN